MREGVCAAFCLYADGLHKSTAPLGAVAGLPIHMLAPEALRAVIRVARAAHLCAALLAGEVFYRAHEAHCF